MLALTDHGRAVLQVMLPDKILTTSDRLWPSSVARWIYMRGPKAMTFMYEGSARPE